MSTGERVLDILAGIAETDEVQSNPDLLLFDLDILDSLKTVELMVALSEAFGVEIAPSEFEREHWATPRQIVEYMQSRIGA
jgi:D-alanine--poly(phosphoribitol) ligase subunit 2